MPRHRMPGTRICVAGVVALILAVPVTAQAGSARDPILDYVNKARARHGLAPFHASNSLHGSASAFAGHLMRAGRFAHDTRIHASSRFRMLGEALAIRIGTRRLRPGATVRAWLHSPGHRALVLSRNFRLAGAGYSRGTFGGRRAVISVLHLGRL
jgi:uncharacterized protein YkwD